MKRIVLHWTAGGYKANSIDLAAYHFVIEGDGTVKTGTHPVSANKAPLSKKYAAHTLNCNSDSIGVSVAAMKDAVEAPFKTGPCPITTQQLAALVVKVASLAKEYKIPVTPSTILTHAEVEKTLGIKQKNKWDITYLPGFGKKTPKEIGDILRKMISNKVAQENVAPKPTLLD